MYRQFKDKICKAFSRDSASLMSQALYERRYYVCCLRTYSWGCSILWPRYRHYVILSRISFLPHHTYVHDLLSKRDNCAFQFLSWVQLYTLRIGTWYTAYVIWEEFQHSSLIENIRIKVALFEEIRRKNVMCCICGL